jgi:transposase
MPKTRRYPPEIRERAVRLVFEHEHEYSSQWKPICWIAEKSDLNRETLRQWVRKAERVAGHRHDG